jgi:hypothetical protein
MISILAIVPLCHYAFAPYSPLPICQLPELGRQFVNNDMKLKYAE